MGAAARGKKTSSGESPATLPSVSSADSYDRAIDTTGFEYFWMVYVDWGIMLWPAWIWTILDPVSFAAGFFPFLNDPNFKRDLETPIAQGMTRMAICLMWGMAIVIMVSFKWGTPLVRRRIMQTCTVFEIIYAATWFYAFYKFNGVWTIDPAVQWLCNGANAAVRVLYHVRSCIRIRQFHARQRALQKAD